MVERECAEYTGVSGRGILISICRFFVCKRKREKSRFLLVMAGPEGIVNCTLLATPCPSFLAVEMRLFF